MVKTGAVRNCVNGGKGCHAKERSNKLSFAQALALGQGDLCMCVAGLLDAMRSTLPAGARIVWMCLENHADQSRKWAMSLERIVAEVNLSIETVVRAVRLLEARGIVRGERDGPGRKATVWHMLRRYEQSPHNGGIEPKESPQNAGTYGEKPPQSAGINEDEYPHNEGINEPETPQNDGIEMRGSPQNAGISNPAKCGDLTHQVSNPPRDPPIVPPKPGGTARRRRATQTPIPPDWNPNAVSQTKALRCGFNLDEINLIAEQMRAWAKANDRRCADWDAQLDRFILRELSQRSRTRGTASQRSASAEIRRQFGTFLAIDFDDDNDPGKALLQ